MDIDPDAVKEAQRNVREHNLAGRIRIVQGDVKRPETFAHELATVQAFNALGIVHELLRDGEEAVVQMFRRMKELFPGRYFFLGEFDAIPDEDWADICDGGPAKEALLPAHHPRDVPSGASDLKGALAGASRTSPGHLP